MRLAFLVTLFNPWYEIFSLGEKVHLLTKPLF